MKKLNCMKSVYTYFFPEVRPFVDFDSKIPKEIYLTSTSVVSARKMLKGLFKQDLELPSTPDGIIDLDMIHENIIDRITYYYSNLVPSLKKFKYKYPTAGSSEGIFHLLSMLRADGYSTIYVLKGEYEGYKEYGNTMKIKAIEIDPKSESLEKLKKGIWFISNPSARDGNIIPNEFINKICNLDHKVVLDLAYVGSTKFYKFDVNNKNIIAVLISFSKPYGVFRFRIGGFTFSREPINSLYANKWFKDIPNLFTALKIVEEIKPGSLYKKYSKIQKEIISKINNEFGLGMRASDALLLGYITEENDEKLTKQQLNLIAQFKREDCYRFCLTPYYELYDKKE